MEWISVNDKLPAIDTDVLCLVKWGVLSEIIQLRIEEHRGKYRTYREVRIKWKKYQWSYYYGCSRGTVTHWMPLPEPPRP